MKNKLRLSEAQLHNIVKESIKNILFENDIPEMGSPKQNALLRKLMGTRHKLEYDDLSVAQTSRMIKQELIRQKPTNPNVAYLLIDNDNKTEYPTFRAAKEALDAIVDEYYDFTGCDSDIRLAKISDIYYKFYGRKSRKCLGILYIKKVVKNKE